MSLRERLPERRFTETFTFAAGVEGKEIEYSVSLGYYGDNRLGEVFLSAGKSGSDLTVATLELSIAISFALQFGCSVETIRSALPRDSSGRPEGALGTLFDILSERETRTHKAVESVRFRDGGNVPEQELSNGF